MVTLTLIIITLAMLVVARLRLVRGFSRVTFFLAMLSIILLAVSCGDNKIKYAGRYPGDTGGVTGDYTFKVSVATPTDIGVKGATSGETVDVIGDKAEGEEVTVTFKSSGTATPTPTPTDTGGGDGLETPITASNETGGCGNKH